MRRSALLVLALAGLFTLPAEAERVERMDVSIDVGGDSSLLVTEEITYDFEAAMRHGIFREIPVRYSRRGAADYTIRLEVVDVTDELGGPHRFTTSRAGRNLRIRIGDPDRKVSGRVTYVIQYRARLAMLHFGEHDEIYWNATGDEWQVPIDAASVRVNLVDGSGRFLDVACFTGPRGATRSDCNAERLGGSAHFATTQGLGPGEGLSIVGALPKGVVRVPGRGERLRARLAPWLSPWLLTPLIAFLGMFSYWRRAGRDPIAGVATPVRYDPPDGLTPAEVGTLVDERADLDDVTATILQLAIDGYLSITQLESDHFLFFKKTDYRLDKKRDAGELKRHQSKLHQALFSGRDSVLVSELRNSFYEELPGIQDSLYAQLSGRGKFFVARPDEVRTRWAIAGGLLLPIGVFLTAVSPAAAVGVGLCGAIVLAFARNMPRRTRRGRRAYEEILGFQEFLKRVDRDRLERRGTATREQFERILPYAIVLGAADAWADAFSEIYLEPPDWYHGYDLDGFRPGRFVSDMGRSLDTIGHSLASQPSSGSGSSGFSSGGGFSGGGMGGGGGGSW